MSNDELPDIYPTEKTDPRNAMLKWLEGVGFEVREWPDELADRCFEELESRTSQGIDYARAVYEVGHWLRDIQRRLAAAE